MVVGDHQLYATQPTVHPIHIYCVTSNAHRIITSGGCFPDDEFPNGGLILLDVATWAEAVACIENDPFFQAGVFSSHTIRRWTTFIFNHKRVPARALVSFAT